MKNKEVILWFSSYKTRNYWYDRALELLEENNWFYIEKKKMESWLKIFNLKLRFEVEGTINNVSDDINQYWVEELFENDLLEFLFSIIEENRE